MSDSAPVEPPADAGAAGMGENESALLVRDWLRANRDEMVADLSTFVGMETPSGSRPHLQEGLAWIEEWLGRRLGSPESRRCFDGGEFGDTVVLDYAGVGQPLLILCHYDTVWDAGTIDSWPFRIDGDIAAGPGVFDMKAGLVQGVWAIRALSEFGLQRPPLRLLLNGSEETGSIPSRAVIEAEAEGVAAVLVLEPAAGVAVKTSRKGVGIWRVVVTGVEAHAGIEPARGASAIDEMARIILKLRAEEAPERGTTVNFGTVQGGVQSNVVAGHAEAMLDVRITDASEGRRVESVIAAVAPTESRLHISFEGGWNRPVMERTPAIGAMYELARSLAHRQGLLLTEGSSGGGSDGSFLAERGISILDGLGPVGGGAHSRSEHIRISDMSERAALVAAIIHAFSEGSI